MNSLERVILNVARGFRPQPVEVEESHINVEAETLYLLRLAAIDAEEKRFRRIQRDGRRAIKLGCE
jgi:hypothetical protein